MLKKLGLLTSVIVSICVIGGFIIQHDQSLARASELLKVRTEVKILYKKYENDKKTNRANNVQERIWVLEERFLNKQMPRSVKEEYRRLQVELTRLRAAGY